MSTVHSSVAPVFSAFVVIYSLFSIICYFGITNNRFVHICQSYCATYKLSAIALGYLFDHIAGSGLTFELSFALMAIVLAFDAFLGFAMLTARNEYSKDTKNYIFLESL
jgi:hypothetical protein